MAPLSEPWEATHSRWFPRRGVPVRGESIFGTERVLCCRVCWRLTLSGGLLVWRRIPIVHTSRRKTSCDGFGPSWPPPGTRRWSWLPTTSCSRGGPHGGNSGILRGIAYDARLLNQDVVAAAYRNYLRVIELLVVSSHVPIIFASGHDHSLQVHELSDNRDGRSGGTSWHHLVSGSASKRSTVQGVEREAVETLFAASLPGYMRLDFRFRGRIQLSVVAGCPGTGPNGVPAGVSRPDAAFDPAPICSTDTGFRTIFSKSIR